tara:strand:- start:314 stop:472 length:159 start_codon:yes stop_codon:yes gene_type:complete
MSVQKRVCIGPVSKVARIGITGYHQKNWDWVPPERRETIVTKVNCEMSTKVA